MSSSAPPAKSMLKKRFFISYSLKLPKFSVIICTLPSSPLSTIRQSSLYSGICHIVIASPMISPRRSAKADASSNSRLFSVIDFSTSRCLPLASAFFHVLVMRVVRGGEVDNIHLGVGENLVDSAVHLFHTVFFRRKRPLFS